MCINNYLVNNNICSITVHCAFYCFMTLYCYKYCTAILLYRHRVP